MTVLGAVSPPRLAALYAEADMFVLASHFEGYGMAYAEAVAHGLPVIGTNAGAIPDTVPAGAGLLVAARRYSPRSLTRCAASSAMPLCAGNWPAPRARPHRSSHLAAVRRDLRARTGEAGMSGFSAEWLTLREPYDLRARNPTVLDAVTAALAGLSPLRIVDLACGTGSTMRALGPFLPAGQSWKLIDNDLGLLAHAADLALHRRARRAPAARPRARP